MSSSRKYLYKFTRWMLFSVLLRSWANSRVNKSAIAVAQDFENTSNKYVKSAMVRLPENTRSYVGLAILSWRWSRRAYGAVNSTSKKVSRIRNK